MLTNRFTVASSAGSRAGSIRSSNTGCTASNCPALVVWGEDDKILPRAYAGLWRAAAGLRVVIVQGCGHLPHDRAARHRTVAEIPGFLGELAP